MKKTRSPLVLTLNGNVKAMPLDTKAYKEVVGQPDEMASIRCGLLQARKGAGRPADDVFDSLEREAEAR